mmetsp:Transcript_23978/g.59422  ORF Transcript_23978/g.59422 Transcript_23978/m.59422 type:complete len:390 (-) Transcript_23978:490-1659(-)
MTPMSSARSYRCRYVTPSTHARDSTCAAATAAAWSPRARAVRTPARVSSASISGAYARSPPGVRYAVSELPAVTSTLRRYTDNSCAAVDAAAPERSEGSAGSKYATGNIPALCRGGGIPSRAAPRDATSAWSTSHRVASSKPHAGREVGASLPRGRHAACAPAAAASAPASPVSMAAAVAAAAEATEATPAPHATRGVSVQPGSPSPCAPRLLMPWSAVKMNAVPLSSPNRASNAPTIRRTPASTARTFAAYTDPSPPGRCACPALSSPSRCSRNTTRFGGPSPAPPSRAARSDATVAPAAASSSVTFPSSTSMVRSKTQVSSAAWSLAAAKSSSSSAYMRLRTCGIPLANRGTTDGAPRAHAAEDWFRRWSNSTALACHPLVMALGSS